MWLGSRSGVDPGYANLNALGFGIQTHLFVMTLVLIPTTGCSPFPYWKENCFPYSLPLDLFVVHSRNKLSSRYFSQCYSLTASMTIAYKWPLQKLLNIWITWSPSSEKSLLSHSPSEGCSTDFKVLRSYREVLFPLVRASVVWKTEEHPHRMFLSKKLSLELLFRTGFLGSLKL